jgi:hypothetical protein
MKAPVIYVVLVASCLLITTVAKAAWLIDAERFHVSVHGQLSCQDCHEDISEKKRHPDPADVNKALIDFFKPTRCSACHEEIAEDSHAGKKASLWQRFDNCIECHDPHYQVGEREKTFVLDLNQSADLKCSLCHDYQPALPEFSDQDQFCML